MGTASTLPMWAAEITYMERFGWTERQLHEEVSSRTVRRISTLDGLRAKAEEVRSKAPAKPRRKWA